jgi:archaellum biogenesis ATPase FlaH
MAPRKKKALAESVMSPPPQPPPAARAPDPPRPAPPPSSRIGFAPAVPDKAPKLMTADQLHEAEQEWLMPGYIPRGRIFLVGGGSGTGKSMMLASLVSAVTRGMCLNSEGRFAPGRAILYSREEDAELDMRPRLIAAGAQMNRVHLGDMLEGRRRTSPALLPDRLDRLEQLIRDLGASLVVLDPITSYLCPGVNKTVEQHVRNVLEPLMDVAANYCCTIAYTCHQKKGKESDPLHKIGGCTAWTDVPRFVMLLSADPKNPGNRVLCMSKTSGDALPPAMRFTIQGQPGRGVFHWGLPCDLTADDLIQNREDPEERDARGEAKMHLKEVLNDADCPANKIIADLRSCGISEKTTRRAKKDLGVTHHHEGTAGNRHMVWRKPENWPD